MTSQRRSNAFSGDRKWVAAVIIISIAAAGVLVTLRRRTDAGRAAKAQALGKVLRQLHERTPEAVDRLAVKQGLNIHSLLSSKAASDIWNSDAIAKAQRVINAAFKPMPMINGHFTPVLLDDDPAGPVLSPGDAQALDRLGASVARVEYFSGGSWKLRGTAFVAGSGTAVTNCHVVAADQGPVPTLQPGALRLDFGQTNIGSDEDRFAVTAILPCPQRTGFDVAFLSVAGRSADSSRPLPPALHLMRVKPDAAALPPGSNVWLVGYPDLPDSDEPLYQQLHALSPSYAKIATPGFFQTLDHSKGFDYVLHNGTSDSGNSGSPLFGLRTQGLIGVDHCCYDTLVRQPSGVLPLPCAFVFGQAYFNESIAAWEVWNDPTLGPQLNATAGL